MCCFAINPFTALRETRFAVRRLYIIVYRQSRLSYHEIGYQIHSG